MLVYEHEMQNVAHNIRWLREKNKLTQSEMAKLLSVSPTSLRKIERGELPPRLRVLVPFNVSSRFGISPADLFSKKLR